MNKRKEHTYRGELRWIDRLPRLPGSVFAEDLSLLTGRSRPDKMRRYRLDVAGVQHSIH